jgi:hypothetical protein
VIGCLAGKFANTANPHYSTVVGSMELRSAIRRLTNQILTLALFFIVVPIISIILFEMFQNVMKNGEY